MLERRRRQPPPTETPAASHRADCDAAHSATRSRSSPPPAPDSPRQSPPSPPRSTAAVAVSRSKPPRDGNCAHQLENYLANQPPASIRRGSIGWRSSAPPGAGGPGSNTCIPRECAISKQYLTCSSTKDIFFHGLMTVGPRKPRRANSPATPAESAALTKIGIGDEGGPIRE
jgi:hypothetical protein